MRNIKQTILPSILATGLLSVSLALWGCDKSPTASEAAPVISYKPITAIKGVAIAPDSAKSTGGAVTSYSVSPALPAGLSLDATTGVISGTPTVAVRSAVIDTVIATGPRGVGKAVIMINPPGVNWTLQNSGIPDTLIDLNSVTWSGSSTGSSQSTSSGQAVSGTGQLVAVGRKGTVWTSSNGATWSVQNTGLGTSNDLQSVIWIGPSTDSSTGQFVVVGAYVIMTSPNGVDWTLRSLTTNFLLSVVWTGSQIVAVGNDQASGTGIILTSLDGVTWTVRYSGTKNFLLSVAWTGSQLVAVGIDPINGGVILTSSDGVTWTTRSSGTGIPISMAWAGSQLVGVGGYGATLTSPDGVNWTARTSGTTDDLISVIWADSQLVAVGVVSNNGGYPRYECAVLTSPDGESWTARIPHMVAGTLRSVTWTGTKLVAVGDYGIILTSP